MQHKKPRYLTENLNPFVLRAAGGERQEGDQKKARPTGDGIGQIHSNHSKIKTIRPVKRTAEKQQVPVELASTLKNDAKTETANACHPLPQKKKGLSSQTSLLTR